MRAVQQPATWWYRLAERYVPSRCREVPEAKHPDRILIRQVAIIPRVLYLQQIASDEHWGFMHRHEFRWAVCIGLWGSYCDRRLGRRTWTDVVAPYLRVMDGDVWHQVRSPSEGHTSLFLGLGRFQERRYCHCAIKTWSWEDHVTETVKRI